MEGTIDPDFVWKVVRQSIKVSYDPKTLHSSRPRPLFELDPETPDAVVALASRTQWPCASCGSLIYRIRARSGDIKRGQMGNHRYVSLTCPLNMNIGCSRGKKATEAMDALVEELKNL